MKFRSNKTYCLHCVLCRQPVILWIHVCIASYKQTWHSTYMCAFTSMVECYKSTNMTVVDKSHTTLEMSGTSISKVNVSLYPVLLSLCTSSLQLSASAYHRTTVPYEPEAIIRCTIPQNKVTWNHLGYINSKNTHLWSMAYSYAADESQQPVKTGVLWAMTCCRPI